MALEDFRCLMRFRVPFCDVDMLRHVNNVAYLVWAETLRCNYFEDVFGEQKSRPCGLIVAKNEFEYLHPLDYREHVAIGCRVARVGRKSFDLYFEVWSETHKTLAGRGRTVMVAYDYKSKASTLVPESWKAAMAEFEAVAPEWS